MNAAQFRRARRRLGFSVEQMALSLRVTAQTVWRWEHGRTRVPGPAVELVSRLLIDKHEAATPAA